MAIIYLLLFIAPQVLLFFYLRTRLPARARLPLAVLFVVFNVPWVFVASRVLFGSLWGIGRIPYIAPFIAWQMLGWVYCAIVAVYVLGKGVRSALHAVASRVRRTGGFDRDKPRTAHGAPLTRRRFLARATYAYAAAGAAVSAQGIWNAFRDPAVTRLALRFPDLPPGLNGLTLAHVSDVHAGIHMEREQMARIVEIVNGLQPDLIVQTGDMIDISRAYVPDYVHAFRDLRAPLGVVTVLGNHDRYTGEEAVIRGVRDAGQTFLQNRSHVVERGGAALALVGIDDPPGWTRDDPQPQDIAAALRYVPRGAFPVLLAHRPGAFDGAAARGIPLTLAGHIHGGQFYLPGFGWSPGSWITKYVMGHFQLGSSQLYVSRGIGVVGIPIRVFTPPEIVLLELRRS